MYNVVITLLLFFSSASFSLTTLPPSTVTVETEPVVAENSILSYYYAIPSKYFLENLIMDSKEERKATLDKLIDNEHIGKNKELFSEENKEYKENNSENMLAVVDEENYYLRMNPNESYGDWSQGFAMTVFIKSNGEHVLAVESHDCGLSCNPEKTKIFLLIYKDGKWSDVTNELLPTEEIDNFVKDEIKHCDEINAKNGTKNEVHDRCVITHGGIEYDLPQNGTNIKAFNGLSEVKFKLKWKNDKFEFELEEGEK